MLNFFRKHQKIFFIIVTIFVVISFSFFGTFSTYSNQADPDRVIEKTVSGSSITLREMEAMNRLLATSFEERTALPNLFNDGVIRKEFLSTGMGALLAERNFDKIKADLEPRLKKAKYYKPYVHPKAPFISAELTWQQYFPGMSRDLALLKTQANEASADDFHLFTRLYLAQLQLPPDSLKQLLLYQQSHYQNLPPDPQLQQTDLSLFGFHSMEDWFGPHFLNQISRFVLNSAAVAIEKGYEVSLDEARAGLIHNVQTALKAYGMKVEETPAFFAQQLRVLQLDEMTAVKTWRKVMLFRRLFHDVGNAVVVDSFLYENFDKYASEGIAVELYQLPQELHIKDVNGLLKLQTYIEAVTGNKQYKEMLPTHVLSAEEVEKRFPELVERRFVVAFSEVNKEQIAARISLKETWDWELDENHWEQIKNAFFFDGKAGTREERFEYLEKLDAKERLKVDAFARMKIVDSHPEWLENGFEKAEVRQETLSVRAKGGTLPFAGISDPGAFADLLQLASLEEETSAVIKAREKLKNFSFDDVTYYRLSVVESTPGKKILSFATAHLDGTLQALVDNRLEIAYPDVRRKEGAVFQNMDGSWKPFQEVREEIGKRLYSEMMTKLQNRPESRLTAFMNEAKKQLEMHPDHPAWVKTEGDSKAPEEQWRLEKVTRTITRATQDGFSKEELLQLPVGAWSEVQTPENGNLLFVHVLEKVENTSGSEAAEGQGILSIGARRFLMSKLLDEMARHDS